MQPDYFQNLNANGMRIGVERSEVVGVEVHLSPKQYGLIISTPLHARLRNDGG